MTSTRTDSPDFKDILKDIADEIAQDGIQTGNAFWSGLAGDDGRIEDAKAAMRRYALHNLNAIREPGNREDHLQSAAHDLNALTNLGVATQIEARQQARALLDRAFLTVFNAAERAIDLLL
jgi:hypothetical protein